MRIELVVKIVRESEEGVKSCSEIQTLLEKINDRQTPDGLVAARDATSSANRTEKVIRRVTVSTYETSDGWNAKSPFSKWLTNKQYGEPASGPTLH